MEKKCTGLKVWLIKEGITQSKIANETGLHKNTVSKLLRTGEGNKSVKELTRLYLQVERDKFDQLLEQV